MRLGEMNAAVYRTDYERDSAQNTMCLRINTIALIFLIISVIYGTKEPSCDKHIHFLNLIFLLVIFLPPYIIRLIAKFMIKEQIGFLRAIAYVCLYNFFIFGIYWIYMFYNLFPVRDHCFSPFRFNAFTYFAILGMGI